MARVVVDVMLKPEILDPQGQAVHRALPSLGVEGVTDVRIGKRIEIILADAHAADLDKVKEIAERLLSNPVIEDFTVHSEGATQAQRSGAEEITTGDTG